MEHKRKAAAATTANKESDQSKFTKNNFDLNDFEGTPWKKYLIIEEPPDEPAFIKIGDIPACTPFNHSLIIGKKKSRKSLFLTYIVSLYEGNPETDILFIDTEQGKRHVWKSRERIKKLTGYYINVLSLRGLNPQERREVILQAIEDGKYKIAIIDGIRDLLSNINDADQCTDLVTWVEWLTVTFGLHVINVLHQNKTDNNARGHIGSELLNKAELTIELELDEKAGCTLVKCESSRDIAFENFAFTHNSEGLPEIVSLPLNGVAMTDNQRKELLQFVFDGEQLKYKEVIEGIKTHFGVGANKAGHILGEFLRIGWIVKNGKDKSPDTVYKYMPTTLKRA